MLKIVIKAAYLMTEKLTKRKSGRSAVCTILILKGGCIFQSFAVCKNTNTCTGTQKRAKKQHGDGQNILSEKSARVVQGE